jgi:hypothetical protein
VIRPRLITSHHAISYCGNRAIFLQSEMMS